MEKTAKELEESIAKKCLIYQSKHGFDSIFDFILEDVSALRELGEKPVGDQALQKIKDFHFQMIEALAICHKWAADDNDIKRIKELMRESTEVSSLLSSKDFVGILIP